MSPGTWEKVVACRSIQSWHSSLITARHLTAPLGRERERSHMTSNLTILGNFIILITQPGPSVKSSWIGNSNCSRYSGLHFTWQDTNTRNTLVSQDYGDMVDGWCWFLPSSVPTEDWRETFGLDVPWDARSVLECESWEVRVRHTGTARPLSLGLPLLQSSSSQTK